MRALLGLLIGGMVLAVSACATTPPPPAPPSVDVSGTWMGTWTAFEGSGGSGQLRGIFRQDGATLYGNFEVSNPGVGPAINRTYVSGMVAGNEVKLFAPSKGTLVVNGDEMTGVVQSIVRGQIQLRRIP
jgi:hypothetical protein